MSTPHQPPAPGTPPYESTPGTAGERGAAYPPPPAPAGGGATLAVVALALGIIGVLAGPATQVLVRSAMQSGNSTSLSVTVGLSNVVVAVIVLLGLVLGIVALVRSRAKALAGVAVGACGSIAFGLVASYAITLVLYGL